MVVVVGVVAVVIVVVIIVVVVVLAVKTIDNAAMPAPNMRRVIKERIKHNSE